MTPPNPQHVAAARADSGPSDLALALRPAPIVSEFTQLALWMAASLAGLVTAVLLAREPFFRALARRMGWLPRKGRQGNRGSPGFPPRRPTPDQALPMLADAIVGNSKAAVASVFGPPRGAVLVGPAAAAASFWDADTWYYPLPRTGTVAVAIEFDEDYARRVHFLQGPKSGGKSMASW
jgi:hypothetical protein